MSSIKLYVMDPTQSHLIIFAKRPTGKENNSDLCRLTHSYNQEEVGLLLHSGSKEEQIRNPGDPLKHFLVLSYTTWW